MYEAVFAVCLMTAPDVCRDQLVPGYEAASQAECEAKLAQNPPVLAGKSDATCAPLGANLDVEEIAPGLFVHAGQIQEPDGDNLGDVANMGFIVGQDSIAIIDTGSARWLGEALWRSIRAVSDKPVSHVILTHVHPDHVLGAGPFVDAGAKVAAHAALPRALADRPENYLESLSRLIGPQAFLSSAGVAVDIAVGETQEIDLGGRILDLRAWPTAHSTTDLTVFDRQTGTLFAGDLVFEQHTPALDGRLKGWRSVLNELMTLNAQRVVPGHGAETLDWPSGGQANARYLKTLEADTRQALEDGLRLGEAVGVIASEEARHWDLFEAYNPRNATVAFTELEWE